MINGDQARPGGGASRRATPARRPPNESREVAESRRGQGQPEAGESQYAPRASARPGAREGKPIDRAPNPDNTVGPEADNQIPTPTHTGTINLTLTDPDTVAMSPEQHSQAVSALSAMIVSWLQRNPDPLSEP